jgi:hypothetical protein
MCNPIITPGYKKTRKPGNKEIHELRPWQNPDDGPCDRGSLGPAKPFKIAFTVTVLQDRETSSEPTDRS